MKKTLALILALVMVAAALAGCGTTLEKDAEGNLDRGAVINMYLTTRIYDFDPQQTITDDAMLKVLRLIYVGLTELDSDGDWEKLLMEDYEVVEDDRDGYSIIIDIDDTKWTDGITVQAKDFVYSWKRLLDTNKRGEAASLLYDIKNARAINLGDCSIDDLGVSAVDTYTLKVTFENENVDLDRFFTNLSSIALVPLREDVVSRYGEDIWSKRAANVVNNGPFTVKENGDGDMGEFRLERNGYYFRDTEAGDYLDKYVIPYKLITRHDDGDLSYALDQFNSENIFYVGELPLSERAALADDAEIEDMMVTESVFFNTENDLFKKAEVRRALSLAIDREKIAEILTFADPAVGYIPNGVFDTDYDSSFREESGDLIATTASLDEARSLLSSAGVRSGSFQITVRDDEAYLAVAEYLCDVWGDLGFNVTIKKAGTTKETIRDTILEQDVAYTFDNYIEAYNNSDFDVILVDMSMPSPDPFGALSQFAGDFSGNGVNLDEEDYPVYGHVTGYERAEYTDLIEKAFVAADEDEKAALLHDAEKMLMEDMPVCPLVYLKSAYLASDILGGFDTDYYGVTDFKRVKMDNYMDYKVVETEAE